MQNILLYLAQPTVISLLLTFPMGIFSRAYGCEVALVELSSVSVTGTDSGASAEILAYDFDNKVMTVVNSLGSSIESFSLTTDLKGTGIRLDPIRVIQIDELLFENLAASDVTPTSIDVNEVKDLLAVAVSNGSESRGWVIFFDSRSLRHLAIVEVGFTPDMLLFDSEGKYLLVANEGEPSSDYSFDPPGSLSVIEIRSPPSDKLQFEHREYFFNTPLHAAPELELRQSGCPPDVQKDIEPEFIALDTRGERAFISLQENNAIATFSLRGMKFENIWSLGKKDHSKPGQGLDGNDTDGRLIPNRLPVFGLYMPDGLASFNVNDQDFIVTANEGDRRDYGNYRDFQRLGESSCSRSIELKRGYNPSDYERLFISHSRGEPADCSRLEVFGGRSFSIWDGAEGHLVYDSGDMFETILSRRGDGITELDKRSDVSGPEPESVEIANIMNRIIAFIGLERSSGIMIFDVTKPHKSSFLGYHSDPRGGHRGPESLEFISAKLSPNGKPLLLVSYEYSASVAVYQIMLESGLKKITGEN